MCAVKFSPNQRGGREGGEGEKRERVSSKDKFRTQEDNRTAQVPACTLGGGSNPHNLWESD